MLRSPQLVIIGSIRQIELNMLRSAVPSKELASDQFCIGVPTAKMQAKDRILIDLLVNIIRRKSEEQSTRMKVEKMLHKPTCTAQIPGYLLSSMKSVSA